MLLVRLDGEREYHETLADLNLTLDSNVGVHLTWLKRSHKFATKYMFGDCTHLASFKIKMMYN